MDSMTRVCRRVALAWALTAMTPIGAVWAQAAPKPMTLAEALDLARTSSPIVAIGNAQVEAARGRQQQAGAGINPEASYTVENFSGSGVMSGIDNAESTIGLSQQIELGGKREARSATAGKQADAVAVRARISRADLDLAVRERFANLSAAEERLDLAQAAVERAQDDCPVWLRHSWMQDESRRCACCGLRRWPPRRRRNSISHRPSWRRRSGLWWSCGVEVRTQSMQWALGIPAARRTREYLADGDARLPPRGCRARHSGGSSQAGKIQCLG